VTDGGRFAAARFAGKYGFASTPASGPPWYLTATESFDVVTPTITGASLGVAETVAVYAVGDGTYLVAVPVVATESQAVAWAWCTGEDDSYVGATVDRAQATPIAIASLDTATSTWSILDGGSPVGLEYLQFAPGNELSVLTYIDGALPAGALTTLATVLVTPGHAAIVSAGAAPPGSDFRYVDLTGLDFTGVDLSGADFTGAILTATRFAGATLTGATFVGATLQGTDFSGAALSDATFAGTEMRAVIWGKTGANAPGASFDDCIMTACRLSGSPSTPGTLAGATFAGADLSRGELANLDLSSTTFYGANLTGATLSFSDLTQSKLGASDQVTPAVLSFSVMQNVTLDQADLYGVDCSGATINGAGTTMNEAASVELANFSNAYLEGISLAQTSLQGVVFDGACLVNVDFTGAQLDAPAGGGVAASLVSCCLQGANFTGATLTGTNLANAAIAPAAGTLQTRYCTAQGPMPPAPSTEPLSYEPTTALDATTLTASTICPNGATYAANLAHGVALADMLQAPGAPTGWLAPACLVPGPAAAPSA
jgi:uncharacterized protein YjbI with pentapeptide repeats